MVRLDGPVHLWSISPSVTVTVLRDLGLLLLLDRSFSQQIHVQFVVSLNGDIFTLSMTIIH